MGSYKDSPAIRLRCAYLRMHRTANQLCRPYGMTADQCVLLRFLSERDGINQKELADLCASDSTTIGRMLDLLEKKGLIGRRSHLTDRRSRHVFLTPEGRQMQNRLKRPAAMIGKTIDNALKEESMEAFLASLERISNAFEQCGDVAMKTTAEGPT
jgi:MarR family transcriptional regulator, transcriptional regulator for hemolysin